MNLESALALLLDDNEVSYGPVQITRVPRFARDDKPRAWEVRVTRQSATGSISQAFRRPTLERALLAAVLDEPESEVANVSGDNGGRICEACSLAKGTAAK